MSAADDEDFRAFVAGRSAALLRFAYLLTGDRRDAEDAVATALARTALAWHRVRRRDDPDGYVRRAIVTAHRTAVRRRAWREQPSGETLLRETLTDPRREPEPDPEQWQLAVALAAAERRHRTRRRTGIALAVAAVLAVLVSTAVVAGRHPPSTTSPPVAVGTATDVVAGTHALYAVRPDPARLWRLDPATGRVARGVPLPWVPSPNGYVQLAADGRYVWSWGDDGTGNLIVAAYQADTLTAVYRRALRLGSIGGVFNGAAMDGSLWLATQTGLYRVVPGTAIRRVAGTEGRVYSVAADPARGRVLAGLTFAPAIATIRIVAVDPGDPRITTTGGRLALGTESIAVVDDRIWVGGYGSGATPWLRRLDPRTLRPIGTSPVTGLGPGAILWPGRSVLWVRAGGDETLSCLDPAHGQVLQRWPAVHGPVASVPGVAVAVGAPGVGNAPVARLALNPACRG